MNIKTTTTKKCNLDNRVKEEEEEKKIKTKQ